MRSYPANSPEAAARIVALALVADGHVGLIEIDTLQRQDIACRLGLSAEAFREVLHGLCEDLLVQCPMVWNDTARIDPVAATMDALVLALLRRNKPTLNDRINQGVWGM